jgi:membrane protein YdbS with pleckstrin-like domain
MRSFITSLARQRQVRGLPALGYRRCMEEPWPAPSDKSWRRPSSRLWLMRFTETAVVTVLVAAAAVGVAAGDGSSAGWDVGAAVVGAGAVLLWAAYRRFRAWAYQERDDDLAVSRGVLFRRLSVVPYGRMQFVDVTAGPVERLFRLATVKLHTAAAASDARIPGLEREEAARLRDRLAALGEAKAAGL